MGKSFLEVTENISFSYAFKQYSTELNIDKVTQRYQILRRKGKNY